MNCFYHNQQQAIGLCKACSRGLCSDCATDLDHGLACKNKHEQRVNELETIISMSAKAHADAPKNLLLLPAFFIFMGSVFAGFALYQGEKIGSFPTVMGLGFIFFGLLFFVRNRKIYSRSD